MKKVLCAILALMIPLTVTGCWDSRELDTLFIVTGLGLDQSEQQEAVDVSVQIVRVTEGGSGAGVSGEGGGGAADGGSNILLEASGRSVLAAVSELRHESTRTLFLHHNQMIVFGRELAEQGIQQHLDLFLRDEETRMETLVLVSDGDAKSVLTAELDQDKISGVAVTRMMRQLGDISKYMSVNMLVLVSKVLQKTTAPLIPIVEVIKEEKKTKLNISRMAVFKKDRMVGELSWEEITGYLWAMGDINEGTLEIAMEDGTVAMNILQAKSTINPVAQPDGRIGILINIDTVLDIEELNGFGDKTLKDVYGMLIQEASHAIEKRIHTTFDKTRELNADIYGLGGMFHVKYPKQWKSLEENWDELYPNMQLVLNVKVELTGTGKTGGTLDMEMNKE